MSFSNLAAEDQANPAASMFGGKEGHKEVVTVQETRSLIQHKDLHRIRAHPPAHFHLARLFPGEIQRGIHGIADHINEQLLKLIQVSINLDFWAIQHTYREP